MRPRAESRELEHTILGRPRGRFAGATAAAWVFSTPQVTMLIAEHNPPFTLRPRDAGPFPGQRARSAPRKVTKMGPWARANAL